MARKAGQKPPPQRLSPQDAPAEAVERIAGRRQLIIARGDVVISRELLPKVNTNPLSREPQWRFRVGVNGAQDSSQFFTSFTHAALRGEELATSRRTRLL